VNVKPDIPTTEVEDSVKILTNAKHPIFALINPSKLGVPISEPVKVAINWLMITEVVLISMNALNSKRKKIQAISVLATAGIFPDLFNVSVLVAID